MEACKEGRNERKQEVYLGRMVGRTEEAVVIGSNERWNYREDETKFCKTNEECLQKYTNEH